MSDSPSAPAATAVFDTAELLENVLLRLDMKSLLRCQQVSKVFKGAIDGSVRLQEALFFRQAPANRAKQYGDDGFNTLLQRGWIAEFKVYEPYTELCFRFDLVKEAAATRKGASWRRMYTVSNTQASSRAVEVFLFIYFDGLPDSLDVIKIPTKPMLVVGEYEKIAAERFAALKAPMLEDPKMREHDISQCVWRENSKTFEELPDED